MIVRIHRAVTMVTLVLLTAIVFNNGALFVALFPGIKDGNSFVASAASLPKIQDRFQIFPPDFQATVTAGHIYVSVESPYQNVLYRRSADVPQPIASLTKLVTALVVLKTNPDWQRDITIISADLRGGAKSPLHTGDHVTLGDLWKMSLISSDNDAAAALARAMLPDEKEFVTAMNEEAKILGLEQARFVEPTGLDPKNIASARDMARIARAAFRQPVIASTLAKSEDQVRVNDTIVRIFSSDQQIKFHEAGGGGWSFVTGKTGFVDEAGYNVVVLAQNASGSQILVTLLGSKTSDTRARETEELFSWAAQLNETNPLQESNASVVY